MIVSLLCLLLCQLAGEVLVRGFGWAIPGPVLGTALLLVLLLARSRVGFLPAEIRDGTLQNSSKGLLAHLSLLFIPAGVGIVQRLDVFAIHGAALAVALVASTILALLATVGTFLAVAHWTGFAGEEPGE